ncbi:4'-phosphopantetheinyl transferase superfamily protein [Streptomyces sp. NPDC002668]|uniref:4'-phosphopantetheinyl transferase family protein n=1 Tax=Streptomyces sp. NPDC002668 TaxID=3154422 RepID=UPI003324E88D
MDVFADQPGAGLFREEEKMAEAMSPGRRREFATVRHCARAAGRRLGMPAAPLLKDSDGAPMWPNGVLGSMTHCPGYRAAAVARHRDVCALGIDAEVNSPMKQEALEFSALLEELDQLTRMRRADDSVSWDRLLCSAKEAVYKAWFPLTRIRLGFDETSISFSPDGSGFCAHIPKAEYTSFPTVVRGRWMAQHGLLLTAVVVLTAAGRTTHQATEASATSMG